MTATSGCTVKLIGTIKSSAKTTTTTTSTTSTTIGPFSGTVDFSPSQDTFININSDVNINLTTLNTYTWPANQPANAVLLKFDLSSIPAGTTITSAQLRLYLLDQVVNDGWEISADTLYPLTLHRITGVNPDLALLNGYTYDGVNSWDPNTCCFSNIPLAQSNISAVVDTVNVPKIEGVQSWNATSIVSAWIAGSAPNYGMLVNSPSSVIQDRHRTFASQEWPEVAKRPILRITYSFPANTPVTTSYPSSEYRGVTGIVAYGDAPGAPAGTPTSANVTLTWQPFTSATAGTVYGVVRVANGGTFSYSGLSACTSGQTSACLACTVTGSGIKSCTDTATGSTPGLKYDYVVTTQNGSNWYAAPSPDTAYRVDVAIPPDDMVLVHRNAVNYEICTQMGRAPDPLNRNQCAYSGMGAVPYNIKPGAAALGLAATHYDQGYSFFVDRWTLGCRWTSSANGGMCGAGATAGSCYGTASPGGAIGIDGNVFYDTTAGQCWIKVAGSWTDLNSGGLSSGNRALAVTNNPAQSGGKVPPLVKIDQAAAFAACQSKSASGYGAKRLPRGREWIAMNASPLAGETGALSDAQIQTLENGMNHPTTHACNTNHHNGVALGAGTAFPVGEIAGDVGDAVASFIIGSTATTSCTSRYGAQDYVGNVLQWTSDYLSSCNGSYECFGAQSPYDDGNRELASFSFGGAGTGPALNNWFVMNWDGSVSGSDPSPMPTHFSLPLGIPLINSNGSQALALFSGFAASRFHGDAFTLNNWPGGAHGMYAGGYWDDGDSTGRWKLLYHPATTISSEAVGARCVVTAE